MESVGATSAMGSLTCCAVPRVICAAVYRKLNEKYRVLWTGDLKVHTVHVEDVVRAAMHVATQCPPGSVYNVADSGNTGALLRGRSQR